MKQKISKVVESVKRNQIQILTRILLTLFVVAAFLLIFFLFDGLIYFRYPSIVTSASESEMEVHFVDVGQGDATLIRFPSDKIMLIDTGENYESDKLITYIEQFMSLCNHHVIDYLILTHPDADHVGGTRDVVENFEIELAFRPKILSQTESEQNPNSNFEVSQTATYENAISSLAENAVEMVYSESGISFNEGGAQIDFLSPIEDSYSATNNYSAVVKIECEGKSFLFTGDSEALVERELLSSGEELDVDVLKVSHHGSDSATTEEFLLETTPAYACISVGIDNQYELPDNEVISRLQDIGAQILMTKDIGSFALAVSDGKLSVNYLNEIGVDFTIVILVTGVLLILIWGVKLPKSKT